MTDIISMILFIGSIIDAAKFIWIASVNISNLLVSDSETSDHAFKTMKMDFFTKSNAEFGTFLVGFPITILLIILFSEPDLGRLDIAY